MNELDCVPSIYPEKMSKYDGEDENIIKYGMCMQCKPLPKRKYTYILVNFFVLQKAKGHPGFAIFQIFHFQKSKSS